MTPQITIALLGWFFVAVPMLFVFLPKRTAAFSGLVFGWLFLPWAEYRLGPLEITRDVAVTLSVVLCILVFDPMRFLRFRPSWFDFPVLVWSVSPFFTSIANDLGSYDGGAAVQSQLFAWGLPYLIGRLYVTDAQALRHLAMVIVFAGILYVPLVVWEMRFSPRLHEQVFGYRTYDHGGTATRRLGGWRPVVFQRHGLMLGLLMGSAALLAGWLWFTNAVRYMPIMPPGMRGKVVSLDPENGRQRLTDALGPAMVFFPVALGLIAVFVLCRALNALLVFAIACAALAALRYLRLRTPLVIFALIPFLFAGTRIAQQFTDFSFDQPLIDAVAKLDEDRAGSVAFRFENEHMLTEKALERPVLGWGGWGRNRIYDDEGNDITVTDGFWVITLGKYGVIGLISSFITLLLPVFTLLRRHNARALVAPELAAASGLAAMLCMYTLDCLPNAMLSPIYVMAAGGLTGLLVCQQARAAALSRADAELRRDLGTRTRTLAHTRTRSV